MRRLLCMLISCCPALLAAGEIEARLVESKNLRKAGSAADPRRAVDPRFVDCDACVSYSVATVDAGTIRVRAEREPRVSISGDQIERVLLAENRDVFFPTASQWVALAVPRQEPAAELERLHEEYPVDRLLISVNGRPTALDTVLTAHNNGIRIGQFDNREDLVAFGEAWAAEHDVKVEWADVAIEQSLQERRQLEERLGSGSSLQ